MELVAFLLFVCVMMILVHYRWDFSHIHRMLAAFGRVACVYVLLLAPSRRPVFCHLFRPWCFLLCFNAMAPTVFLCILLRHFVSDSSLIEYGSYPQQVECCSDSMIGFRWLDGFSSFLRALSATCPPFQFVSVHFCDVSFIRHMLLGWGHVCLVFHPLCLYAGFSHPSGSRKKFRVYNLY